MSRELIAKTRLLIATLKEDGQVSVPAQYAGKIAKAYEETLDLLAAAEMAAEKHDTKDGRLCRCPGHEQWRKLKSALS